MNKALRLALLALATSVAAPASAQFAKPEDAYKYRTSVMYLQSQHMGRISAQLRSDKPNLAVVAENAMVLDTVNKLFVSAFPEGSAVGNSRAKPEIWKDQARFNQYATRLDGDVAKLVAAAKSGDPAAARSAFQAVGQVCKACHDDFRRD